MGAALDTLRAWRHPRQIMGLRLSEGVREDRALIFLMVACFLIFVAQWPRLVRDATLDPSTPLDARLGGALLGWLFLVPLAFYAFAALSHLIARMLGGKGSWFSSRMALFWALLAAAPMWLLNGLVTALVDVTWIRATTGAIALGGFLLIWAASLIEAESGKA